MNDNNNLSIKKIEKYNNEMSKIDREKILYIVASGIGSLAFVASAGIAFIQDKPHYLAISFANGLFTSFHVRKLISTLSHRAG